MKRDTDSQAYNALLTLIDEPKRQKQKDEVSLQNHGDMDEFLNSEEEEGASESESEEEIDLEDEEDVKDPFETHFQSPPEQLDAGAWKTHKTPLKFAPRSTTQLPEPNVFEPIPTKPSGFASLKLKYRLQAPFKAVNGDLTSTQRELATPIFNYQDVLHTARSWENYKELRNLSILHIVNHVFKTRDRVVSHNQKLAQNEDLEFKDQGFTRPKVLVVLPMRNSAADFVKALIKLCGMNECENRKRFFESFDVKSDALAHKPKDFQHQFKGNTNDLFCLGIKFTRQAIKLYTSFYASDIIIASPLGLRLIISGDKKKADHDFLSSIEVVYMDQMEAMQMQSWENITILAKHLNLMPKQSHDCDFSRIRSWALDEKSKFLRQTIALSAYLTPEIQGFYAKYCHNLQGKLKIRQDSEGVMSQVGARIRQVCSRIEVPTFDKDADVRFQHFVNVILPSIERGATSEGTLIFVPSYVDFVRVRNYMDKKNASFATLSEYTSAPQISRGRTYFNDRRCKMMLYTQRLHYFRRYSIKGCNQIIFYGLPDDAIFYREIVRFLARTALEQGVDPDTLKVHVIYSKWDSLKLERVVGTNRVGKLLAGASDSYEFF